MRIESWPESKKLLTDTTINKNFKISLQQYNLRLSAGSGKRCIANIEYLNIFTKLASGVTIGIFDSRPMSYISNRPVEEALLDD